MHWACVNGFVDGVSLLLQAGVPLDIPDHGGKTSLMYEFEIHAWPLPFS